MRAEEQDLRDAYGEEFEDYARRVPLFVPRLGRAPQADDGAGGAAKSKFLWSRVRRNREHRNLASLLAVAAILLLRYFLRW